MIDAKTECQICRIEKEITKEGIIDLIQDCNTQERLISFVIGIRISRGAVIVPVMCPECEKKFNLNR